MRLYLDACAIIYSIEGLSSVRDVAVRFIDQAEAAPGLIITSHLSRLECRVRPLREKNEILLARS
jgi:hypothetical protein